MKSKQQSRSSCCGDPDLNGGKADLAEPPKATACGGTVAAKSCCATVAPHVSAAHAARETAVTIATASTGDLGEVLRLLESLQLPTAGVADHFGDFFVAREKGGHVVAAIGLERYGTLGLLRSAAVAPTLQKSGIGSKLTRLLIGFARGEGLTELVLFTPSARDFFARFGFIPANREDYSMQLKASSHWGDCACRNSAEFMRLGLRSDANAATAKGK